MPTICRTLAAFVLAPLLASAGYVYISWAGEVSWFTFLLTVGVAYGITLALMLPSFLILLRVDGFNAYTSVAVPFLILLAVSAIHSTWSYSDFDMLEVGKDILVTDGTITSIGWQNILADATGLGLLGAAGGAVFFSVLRFRAR